MIDDALQSAIERARARGHAGAEAAAEHADLVHSNWTERAITYIHLYARQHPYLRCEHCRVWAEHDGLPPPTDKRAWGWAIQEARRQGLIEPAGYEAAISSNGSPKVRWKSLVYSTGYREDIE